MNPELFAFCADALRDPTTGLNALAASLPVAIDAPEIPTCEIVTAMEEGWAGRVPIPEEVLADGPLCIIRQADEFTVGASPEEAPFAEEPVLVFVAMRSIDSQVGLYVVKQLLRTALRSLVSPFLLVREVTRQQVDISKPTRILHPLLTPASSDTVLAAAAVVLFPVYDPWSAGAYVAVTP